MTRTIVMIHPGSLGDVLLAVPAMARLRIRFPTHRHILCAERHASQVLLACQVIDEWTSLQGRSCLDLLTGVDSDREPVRAWLADCDLAVVWMQDPDGNLGKRIRLSGAREAVVCSPFSLGVQAIHQRDRFCEAMNEILSDAERMVRLTVPDSLVQLGQSYLGAAGFSMGRPLVVVHPGSGSAHKCASPELLSSVVTSIQNSGADVMILEGPSDREQVERLLQLCGHVPAVLKGLDVPTVAGILAQAQLFIGQDSGMTHLAGLIGVRTVVLFGPTDPARWAPGGDHVTVVQGASCQCCSWDEVSRCEDKPCLRISQDDLVAVCLAHLKEIPVRSQILLLCLVTAYLVC